MDLGGSSPQSRHLHDFMLHLTLNHSVVIEKLRNEAGVVTGERLSASSPDEEAFVQAGNFFKCVAVMVMSSARAVVCFAAGTLRCACCCVYSSLLLPPLPLLCVFLLMFRYKFVARKNDIVILNIRGKRFEAQVLHTLAYSQMRKRMSVICRVQGRIVLFMKVWLRNTTAVLSLLFAGAARWRCALAMLCCCTTQC